jgi:hypothetical protein
MLTDAPPRKANRAGFLESDRIRTLDLPQDGSLLTITKSIESAMRRGGSTDVRRTCGEFLVIASEFYEVPACGVRVLAARPLRVREHWTTELFGDYSPETMLIRLWMRTAVRRQSRPSEHSSARYVTNFVITSTFRNSGSRIRGTHAGSTSGRLCCTTMRGARRSKHCSGCPWQAGAGASTGGARIVHEGPMRLQVDRSAPSLR